MEQQIRVYVQLLGEINYIKRVKELRDLRDIPRSTVKTTILSKLPYKFNVISIKIPS